MREKEKERTESIGHGVAHLHPSPPSRRARLAHERISRRHLRLSRTQTISRVHIHPILRLRLGQSLWHEAVRRGHDASRGVLSRVTQSSGRRPDVEDECGYLILGDVCSLTVHGVGGGEAYHRRRSFLLGLGPVTGRGSNRDRGVEIGDDKAAHGSPRQRASRGE